MFKSWPMLSLLSLFTFAGCAVDAESIDDADLDEEAEAQDLIPIDGPFPTKPPPDTPSTLTFFANANLTGTQTTISLTPVAGAEKMTTVPWSQIGAVGSAGAKSVRLTCGTRPTSLMMYGAANNTTTFLTWITGSNGDINCFPGQTVSLALPNGFGLNSVKSALALVHPVGSRIGVDFTGTFPAQWNASLDAELPSGASRDGSPTIKSGSSRGFRIDQRFWLDSAACFERSAQVSISVTLNGPGDVSAVILDEYVDTPGWPEPWDCQSSMESAFHAGMNDLAQRLRDDLSMDLTAYTGGKCRAVQYFQHATPTTFQIVSAGAELPITSCL